MSTASELPRVLFIVDVHGWAYDLRAIQWQNLLKDQFAIDIVRIKDLQQNPLTPKSQDYFGRLVGLSDQYARAETHELAKQQLENFVKDVQNRRSTFYAEEIAVDHRNYDGIVFFYHRALSDKRIRALPFPRNKVAVCINNEKWMDEGPESTCDEYLSGVKLILACNDFIKEQFSKVHPKVMRASQAINHTVFKTDREDIVRNNRIGEKFVIGWSGDYNNEIKNVDTIRKACEMAGVKLLISKNRSQEELNEWYNTMIDAVICASSSEGGPLMLLEAGACSRPIITTPVGLAREIVKDSETGLLIPHHNVTEMVSAIQLLANDLKTRERLGRALNKEILTNWTYEARKDEIASALDTLCRA